MQAWGVAGGGARRRQTPRVALRTGRRQCLPNSSLWLEGLKVRLILHRCYRILRAGSAQQQDGRGSCGSELSAQLSECVRCLHEAIP